VGSSKDLRWVACSAVALCLIAAAAARAQGSSVNDLKAKIFDARMAQKTFVNGLRFCEQLDGTNFYFEPRNRVLNLEEYHHSLESLAGAQVYNPETRRPWTAQDADARWEQVKREAVRDKENCELVKNLPQLEKQLADVEAKNEEPPKKD
jgi:tRNA nucleotidyltransferase/poly(A) polymerase